MKSLPLNSTQLRIAVAVLLCFLAGAVLERKSGFLSVSHLLQAEQPLTPIPLTSDPNLERLTQPRVLAPADDTAFAQWQAAARAQIIELGGSEIVPGEKHVPSYRVLSETRLPEGTLQRLIAFKTFDGSEIPAYLHIPQSEQPLPGILVISGHVKAHESGIEQLANEPDSYQHAAARQLAAAGAITLAPELRGFGYLGEPYNTDHRLVAYNAILQGTSYKWTVLRDLGYAMSLLRQLEGVDVSRIGVTGASLGGELAVNYSALDPGVSAVVFQSFSGGHGIKEPRQGDRDDQPHYCHVLPVIDRMVAQEHWYWLLAPRPVLGVRGSENKPFDSADRDVFGAGWASAGADTALELQVAKGGHEYFVEPAVEFFASVFGQDLP